MHTGTLQVISPSNREIAMTRVFDAPCAALFKAYTEPELLRRWLGTSGGWSLPVCEVDLREGGAYRYLWSRPDGAEIRVDGIYHRLVPFAHIASSEIITGPKQSASTFCTVTFAEQRRGTRLTVTLHYPSRGTRDAVLLSPMAQSVTESYHRLTAILAGDYRMPLGRVESRKSAVCFSTA